MKMLLKIMDGLRPNFSKDGKFKLLKPIFDATDSAIFSPNTLTANSPHIRDPLDMKRYMLMVIVAMMPCVFTAIYFFGLRVLAMIIVSYTVGAIVEFLFAIVRKEEINEGFLVTGLIFPLTLPPGIPLWMVGAGVAFGVIFGKELFGGTGRNLFNPALVGRCFLALSYPVATTTGWFKPAQGTFGGFTKYIDKVNADAISAATPLIQAKQCIFGDIYALLIGNVPGCIGETSAIAIIIGGLFLLFTRVANWRTVVGVLAAVCVLEGVLNAVQPETFGPVLWHLCAGGLLFGTFFMATDPVTGPITNAGKWIYGVFIGLITILIRNFTGYVEGMMFAILLGNIIAPLFDEVAHKIHFKRLSHEK